VTQDELKQAVALEAIKYVEDDAVIGVGTGSTANCFIDELAKIRHRIKGAVASSVKTAERLKAGGIFVEELNNVDDLPVYVDGADEVNPAKQLIKGAGGALTREKIVAASADEFVCIVDDSKLVPVLGTTFPLPVEVIPMARGLAARALVGLGGTVLGFVFAFTAARSPSSRSKNSRSWKPMLRAIRTAGNCWMPVLYSWTALLKKRRAEAILFSMSARSDWRRRKFSFAFRLG